MKDRNRLLVKDANGNIKVASHDKIILKDSYVQTTNIYDAREKITGKKK